MRLARKHWTLMTPLVAAFAAVLQGPVGLAAGLAPGAGELSVGPPISAMTRVGPTSSLGPNLSGDGRLTAGIPAVGFLPADRPQTIGVELDIFPFSGTLPGVNPLATGRAPGAGPLLFGVFFMLPGEASNSALPTQTLRTFNGLYAATFAAGALPRVSAAAPPCGAGTAAAGGQGVSPGTAMVPAKDAFLDTVAIPSVRCPKGGD